MIDVKLAELLGQAPVSEFLRGVVARGRYANAYLFHGPAGVGKCTAALAFARAALCERVPAAARPDDGPSLFGDAPEAAPPGGGDDADRHRDQDRERASHGAESERDGESPG